MHLRLVITALCIAALAATDLAPQARAATPKLGSYYVAIGDSFSYGYLTPSTPADPQCRATTAPGFVCVFYRYLKRISPGVQLRNFSEPGADSCVLVQGHRCYDPTPRASELDAALAFIRAHPGGVSPITVTIGGNDLLSLVWAALSDPAGTARRLPGVLTNYRSNLDTILSRLRGAAPDAQIIVTTQPNSLGGLGTPPLPPGFPALAKNALGALNSVIKQEAPKYRAVVADSAAAFNANPGGAVALTYVPISALSGDPFQINIHPTAEGYAVYARAVIAASGYTLPLMLSVRLAKAVVAPGSKNSVAGLTSPLASVRIRVDLPLGHHRTALTRADGTGAFSRAFRVGRYAGTATVRVCATDSAGQKVCKAKAQFAIR